MILVKLRGGLSNQMFQYAAARRLAAVHNTSVRIDTGWYDHLPAGATPRTYELHHLKITGTLATNWELIGTNGVRNTPRRQLPVALYRKIHPRYRFIAERHFHFDENILALPDNVCLFGYWISERYFSDAAELIGQEFQFRNPPSTENKGWIDRVCAPGSVAVHVRRGDYVTHPEIARDFGHCSSDYYLQCMDRIRAEVPRPTFFVFSDDVTWAKNHLGTSANTHYLSHNTGNLSYEDLRLMASAQNQIISNSTFGWWAAWLNTNKSKVVYAPKRWLATKDHQTGDVLPPDWIRV